MKGPIQIIRHAWQRLSEARRRARFVASVQHIHGPKTLDVAPGDVVLIALVRNDRYYLDGFFRHYRAMGVQHFVFIDNGSTDDTIARIAREKGTVVDQCKLPLAGYGDLIRQYPAHTYGQDRWCLYVDVDEVLDFEGRTTVGIKGLTSYLKAQGYAALVAQVLDMFPKSSLQAAHSLPFKQALLEFLYFDISAIEKMPYHAKDGPFSTLLAHNITSNPDIQLHFGGIRGKVFGENRCLTKHPLIFNGPGVTPAPHPHVSTGVTCADLTAVIKHYEFARVPACSDTGSRVNEATKEDTQEPQRGTTHLPDVSLFSLEARRWNRVELLYRAGFLTASEAYSDHVQACIQNGEMRPRSPRSI